MVGWGVPIAVLGMLLATLLMAAILRRYQEHQAFVRMAIRSLQSGATQIEDGLAALQSVPLSRELRVALRADVLARYQRIRKLYRRYPAIDETLRKAEERMASEGAPVASGIGPIEDEKAFRRMLTGFETLTVTITRRDSLPPIPNDVRSIFRRELGEKRAELIAQFHLVAARSKENEGNVSAARAHLTTLLHALRQRGPSTDFVRELQKQAEAALAGLMHRQLGGAALAPDLGAQPETSRRAG